MPILVCVECGDDVSMIKTRTPFLDEYWGVCCHVEYRLFIQGGSVVA